MYIVTDWLHLPSVTAGGSDEETLSLLWAIFTSPASVVIFTVVGTFEGLATSCCIEETVDNDEVDGDGSGMSYENTLENTNYNLKFKGLKKPEVSTCSMFEMGSIQIPLSNFHTLILNSACLSLSEQN